MSPDDVQLFESVGRILLFIFSNVVVTVALYGQYLILFVFCIRAIMRGTRFKNTWILFTLLSALCVLFTASAVLSVVLMAGLIRADLIRSQLRGNVQPETVMTLFDCWVWTSNGCAFFVLADVVVVWRACVVWSTNKAVKTTLSLLWSASFGATILAGVSFVTDTHLKHGSVVPPSSLPQMMYNLSFSSSLATNFIATALFSYKTYRLRKLIGELTRNTRSSLKVLPFLAESGAVFCIVQIICLSLNFVEYTPYSTAHIILALWQNIANFIAAAYPMTVIILVRYPSRNHQGHQGTM